MHSKRLLLLPHECLRVARLLRKPSLCRLCHSAAGTSRFLDSTHYPPYKHLWPLVHDKNDKTVLVTLTVVAYLIRAAAASFVVEPDLDFRHYLEDPEATYTMLRDRGLPADVETIKDIAARYKEYCRLARRRRTTNRDECFDEYRDISSQLSSLRPVIADLLSLPNPRLLSSTPRGHSDHYKAGMLDKRDFPPSDTHLNFLRAHQLCVERSGHIYVCGRAAQVQHELQQSVVHALRRQHFTHVHLPSMARPAVVDACCESELLDPFTLTDDRLDSSAHDVGDLVLTGHRLSAWAVLLTNKQLAQKHTFPVKWFSIGNMYSRVWPVASLHHSAQQPVVSVCVLCNSAEQCEQQYRALVEAIKLIFIQLHLSQYLAFDVSAPHLRLSDAAETLFVSDRGLLNPIAHVSYLGDYVSRRIRLCLQTDQQQQPTYVHMLYANVQLHSILADYIVNKPKLFDESTV